MAYRIPKGVICGGAVDGSNQLGAIVTCQAMTASPAGAGCATAGRARATTRTAAATSDPTMWRCRLMAHLPVAIRARGYHPTHQHAERVRERNARARGPRHADGRADASILATHRRGRPARRASDVARAPDGRRPRPL